MTVEIQKQMFPYVQVALVIFTNLSRVTKMKHMASLFQLFFPGMTETFAVALLPIIKPQNANLVRLQCLSIQG